MAIEVIGAGFGRTGTLSLKVALEELGFGPCYHMMEVFAHPEHLPLWEAAAHGRPVVWDEVFRDYRATVDWPGAAFYAELMATYPEARVILSTRDPERWYQSALNTIYAVNRLGASAPLVRLMERLGPGRMRARRMIDDLIWRGTFGGEFEDRSHALAIFARHNAEVRRRVPADKLLVYEVKQGWEPLCAFLGVPVPQGKPFPHLNDTAEFRRRIRGLRALSYATPFAVAALMASVVWGLRGAWRRWTLRDQ